MIWTANARGAVTVTGKFRGDDSSEGAHTVEILHNGTTVYTNTISSSGQVDVFNLSSISVRKGDTISFVCETGSGPDDLSTGLKATITT